VKRARIELRVAGAPSLLQSHEASVSTAVGATHLHFVQSDPGDEAGWERASVVLSGGEAQISLRRVTG